MDCVLMCPRPQVDTVQGQQKLAVTVKSGLKDLLGEERAGIVACPRCKARSHAYPSSFVIQCLKSTGSAFEHFLRDEYTDSCGGDRPDFQHGC